MRARGAWSSVGGVGYEGYGGSVRSDRPTRAAACDVIVMMMMMIIIGMIAPYGTLDYKLLDLGR